MECELFESGRHAMNVVQSLARSLQCLCNLHTQQTWLLLAPLQHMLSQAMLLGLPSVAFTTNQVGVAVVTV